MGDSRRRLDKLEAEDRANTPQRLVVVRQSLDDPDVYRDGDGAEYTRAEVAALGARLDVTVIRVEYVNDWPPHGAAE